MDAFGRDDLKALLDHPPGRCVSIFLPTHRAGSGVQENPIRFRNLVREAERRLGDAGLRTPEVGRLLEPLLGLLEDGSFWQHQGDGLAAFRAEDLVRTYRLGVPLPEVVVAADRFHLKPLLPLLTDTRFYVLALSQNQVRLYRGTPQTLAEVPLGGVPTSLAEALKYDDPQRQLQFHTGAPAAGGRRAAIFHGHAVQDNAKDNVLRFFQLVDAGLHAHLRDERAPLVLAGVEYLLPLYRQANHYAHLVDGGVTGNPDGVSAQALHARAWPLADAVFRARREAHAARYRALAGTGLASSVLADVLPAAHQGRVELLFVAAGEERWGTVDAQRGIVRVRAQPEPGDEDLLNVAALQTLVRGGTVYAVEPAEVPGDARDGLAAVFRY